MGGCDGLGVIASLTESKEGVVAICAPWVLESSVEATAGGVKGRTGAGGREAVPDGRPLWPTGFIVWAADGEFKGTFGRRRRDLWALNWGGSKCSGEATEVPAFARLGIVRRPNGPADWSK